MIRQKIRVLACGLGLGFCAAVGVSATAYATGTTCYTGCTPTTPGGGSTPPAVTSDGGAVTASSSGLAFTGADIEGMVAVGGGALAVGGLLVLGGRRRRAAQQ